MGGGGSVVIQRLVRISYFSCFLMSQFSFAFVLFQHVSSFSPSLYFSFLFAFLLFSLFIFGPTFQHSFFFRIQLILLFSSLIYGGWLLAESLHIIVRTVRTEGIGRCVFDCASRPILVNNGVRQRALYCPYISTQWDETHGVR